MTAYEQAEKYYDSLRKERIYMPEWSQLTVRQRVLFYKKFLELEIMLGKIYIEVNDKPSAANINPCSEVVLKKKANRATLSQIRINRNAAFKS